MTLKLIKVITLAIIALLFTFVSYINIIDYPTGFSFVQHVMSMDTTFKSPALMTRAITNTTAHTIAFWLIILAEMSTAILSWAAAVVLFLYRHDNQQFQQKKYIANIALFIGFILYMLGFIVIAGEWFVMWQSKQWNGLPAASMFVTFILLLFIFINQDE